MSKSLKLPPYLLLLDLIGILLIGLGLYELVSESSLIPEQYQFEQYPLMMIVVGVLLTLPMVVFVIRKTLSKVSDRDEI